MNRLALLALALVLALSLVGCSSTGGGDDAGKTQSGSSAESSGEANGGITSPEDLKAALDADYGDSEWYPDVTDVTAETFLGAQVAVVHMSWSAADTDYETLNRKQTALSDAMSGYEIEFAPNNVVMWTEGNFQPLGSSGQFGTTTMDQAFDLPPAPMTAEEVTAWLAAVYGPGGLVTLGPNETWYDSIVSITAEDVDYGSGTSLVVVTSAPTLDSTDASLVNMAVMTTGSPLLDQYSIRAADGASSGNSASGASPGMHGWFYQEK